jgi:hypothetical protein
MYWMRYSAVKIVLACFCLSGFVQCAFGANGAVSGIYGIVPGCSFETFKLQLSKAHIAGLKKIGEATAVEASYKTKELNIGSVHWNPEFEFANVNGTYRLVYIVGSLPPGGYPLVLKELTRQHGRPRSDQDFCYWHDSKTSSIVLSKAGKLHRNDQLTFTEQNLWDTYVRGASPPPNWFERLEDPQ